MPALRKGYDPAQAARGARDRASASRAGRACARSSSPTAATRARPTTASPAPARDRPPRHAGRRPGAAQGGCSLATRARPASTSTGRHWTPLRTPRARQQLPRRRDRELLAHVRRDLPGCREPGHALSVHRRPRPRLCRRAADDLPQRALSRAGRMPAREPHGQPDLPQRLAARRFPARAARAPRVGAAAASSGSSRM